MASPFRKKVARFERIGAIRIWPSDFVDELCRGSPAVMKNALDWLVGSQELGANPWLLISIPRHARACVACMTPHAGVTPMSTGSSKTARSKLLYLLPLLGTVKDGRRIAPQCRNGRPALPMRSSRLSPRRGEKDSICQTPGAMVKK